MIKELAKVATRLDALGLTAEADVVDTLIRKIAATDREDFNRRNDAFYEKMRSSGTPMSPMGEHRPYMHELYPSRYTQRKPTTQAEFDSLMGPASEYGDPMRFDLLNQRGAEPEQFSERLHDESYEMDEDEILSGIDEDRELEKAYPAAKKDPHYDKYDTDEFDPQSYLDKNYSDWTDEDHKEFEEDDMTFKEASRRMRGMRKSS